MVEKQMDKAYNNFQNISASADGSLSGLRTLDPPFNPPLRLAAIFWCLGGGAKKLETFFLISFSPFQAILSIFRFFPEKNP